MTARSPTEYDDKIAELITQEEALRLERLGLEFLRALALCPFKVGDVLIDRRGHKAVLKEISASSWQPESYAMRGAMLRKDGSEGRIAKLDIWAEWEKEIK